MSAAAHFSDFLDIAKNTTGVVQFIYEEFQLMDVEQSCEDFSEIDFLEEHILEHLRMAYMELMDKVVIECERLRDTGAKARSLRIAYYYFLVLSLRVEEDLKSTKAHAMAYYYAKQLTVLLNQPPGAMMGTPPLPPSTEALFRFYNVSSAKSPPVAGAQNPIILYMCRQIVQATVCTDEMGGTVDHRPDLRTLHEQCCVFSSLNTHHCSCRVRRSAGRFSSSSSHTRSSSRTRDPYRTRLVSFSSFYVIRVLGAFLSVLVLYSPIDDARRSPIRQIFFETMQHNGVFLERNGNAVPALFMITHLR